MASADRIRATIGNPAWRLANLYSIVNKQGQQVPFHPNVVQAMVNNDPAYRKMILKARQFGISTGEILKQLDHTMFNRNVTSCILAHEQDSIQKLFRIVNRAHRFMHPEVRPRLGKGGGSKYEFYFPDVNSRIYCDLESRSDTIQWLHVSEAAFMDPARLGSTLQAVPIGTGRVTIETTANGMGNHFYDMWTDPDPAVPYRKMFFPWFLFPDYAIETPRLVPTNEERELIKKARVHFGVALTHEQLAFRRMKRAELKMLNIAFAQEYPEDDQSCFLASGQPAMDLVEVKKQLDALAQPLEDDGVVKIYEKYDRNTRYVVGADTAEGVGGDASTATVFEQRSRKQVATLHGNFKPADFAHRLVELCLRYKTSGRGHPLLGVERNNHGHAVILALEEIEKYPNLYQHTDERTGWLTDRVTRPVMIDAFIDGVENRSMTLTDAGTLRECLTLVNADGKIEAAKGKNDDRVVAAAIALQLCIRNGVLDLYDNIGSRVRT